MRKDGDWQSCTGIKFDAQNARMERTKCKEHGVAADEAQSGQAELSFRTCLADGGGNGSTDFTQLGCKADRNQC